MKTLKTVLSLSLLLIAAVVKGDLVTLTSGTGDVTLHENDILTGTGGSETHVSIAAGATVTLRDVDITAIPKNQNHMWPGISCEGSATIILEGANAVKGGAENYPGVMVPFECTLTIQGGGSLDASSSGFGAGIGAAYGAACGHICILGGVVTATGGTGAAGIGGAQASPGGGSISILGGTVSAIGGSFASGIGCGLNGMCDDILLRGGTVVAMGGEEAPGIGAGAYGACGDVTIAESVVSVTARGGPCEEGTPYSVGAGTGGMCGTVTVEKETGNETGAITVNPFVYNPCITNITSLADWNAFASRVNRGVDSYKDMTVTLAADISVTTMVGRTVESVDCPFSGTFEGGGHSIAVDISAGDAAGALFGKIRGATIRNLNVSGSVAGGMHSAGLVGGCANASTNAIIGCTVSVAVSAAGHAGGIVGHGGDGNENLFKDCVFSGTISGFSGCAGGILGWGDRMTLVITNCLMNGSFVPASGGKYHPIACKNGGSYTVNATVSSVYYLHAMKPTAPSGNVVSGGEPVSATLVPFEWTMAVAAADGLTYYKAAHMVTLTAGTGLVTLQDGDILTGTGGQNTRVEIAAGATVMLRDVNVTGIPNDAVHQWAGITCKGYAAIILKNANVVKGGFEAFPGIVVPEGCTLVVQGDGRLEAGSNGVGNYVVGDVSARDDLIVMSDASRYMISRGAVIAGNEGNALTIAQHNGRTEPVQIKDWALRRDGSWNTLCLPFSMSAAQIAASPLAGAVIKKLDGAASSLAGGKLTVNFADVAAIEAGRPYIIRWEPVITISSTADWNAFASSVSSGTSYAGRFVRLAADISVSTMAGASRCPFSGTLDGNGHTITVNLTGGGDGVSLFYFISGATIQNLKVTGNITSSRYRPAAFASFVEGNNTIKSCWSEVTINASNPDWIDAGGIVGRVTNGARLAIKDCAFTGRIRYTDSNGYEGGGMVGWRQPEAKVFIERCVFAPQEILAGLSNDDTYVFVSNNDFLTTDSFTHLEKCYYNAIAKGSVLKTGEVGAYYIDDMIGDMSIGNLGAILGGNWEVRGNDVVPKMNAPCDGIELVNPVFVDVTVSDAGASDGMGQAEFVGTTSPVALGAGYQSSLLLMDDGTLACPEAGAMIPSCQAYFRLNGLVAGQDVTSYAVNVDGKTFTGSVYVPLTTGYGLWAAANNLLGAWDAADSDGVHNAFHYAFGKPAGAFADSPLFAITIEDGQAVIHTPPLVNDEGFTFGIVASDVLGGEETATYQIDPSGRTVIPDVDKSARFFRLRALAGYGFVDPLAQNQEQLSPVAYKVRADQTVFPAGWYVVTDNVTISGRITIRGNVNLILCDGAMLNAASGITVPEGSRLTVWGQGGEYAVPGTTATTRGTGSLYAQTPADGAYSQAAAIGGENVSANGDIVINGGVVIARGAWGAGIGRGNVASGAIGSVTINGGYVEASGSLGSAGIGSGAYADSCPVTITGGYVVAAGGVYTATGQATAGIGTGRPRVDGSMPLTTGKIIISGGTVIAQAGNAPANGTAAQAIGVNSADAEHNGTQRLVLGDMRAYASASAASPVSASARGDACRGTWVKLEACTSHDDGNADQFCDICGSYLGPVPPVGPDGVVMIGSTDDWNVFAESVNAGKSYAWQTVRLTADIAVSTPVGTEDHRFGGTFDGAGHTLHATISNPSAQAMAPFSAVIGATIHDVVVTGTITGAYHTSGLVGICSSEAMTIVSNCVVSADISAANYAGGIVGHGGSNQIIISHCVFSGSISGFANYAGGILGWCDNPTLTMADCLTTGSFAPASGGRFHPVACKYDRGVVSATVERVYYLNTIVPTATGNFLISGAEGIPVSATWTSEYTQPVKAVDGKTYYSR